MRDRIIGYVDTSVILRIIFGEENPFKKIDSFQTLYTSPLLKVESLRAIDRLRLQGKFSDSEVALRVQALLDILKYFCEIALDIQVLNRASESFPTVVGTLDALHLSSAWRLKESQKKNLFFLTHDLQLKRAAQAMGFDTLDL